MAWRDQGTPLRSKNGQTMGNGSVSQFFLRKREKLHPRTTRAMLKDTIDGFTVGKDECPVRCGCESDLYDKGLVYHCQISKAACHSRSECGEFGVLVRKVAPGAHPIHFVEPGDCKPPSVVCNVGQLNNNCVYPWDVCS